MSNPPTARFLSDREFVLEHTFNAPAAAVFAAYTDPAIIPKWWGVKGATFRVETLDLRPGGKWRFVQRLPNGQEMAFSGSYVEVLPVTRLVYTFAAEGQPGPGLQATVELREADGKTHLTLTNLCASKEARDAVAGYGAAAGAKAAWDRLAEVLGGA